MENYISGEVISTIVTISFKVLLKDLLEKLNLPPASFLYEKYGSDHNPTFVAYTNLDDGYRRHVIYRGKSSTEKEAQQEAVLKAIRHLRTMYDLS